jgi:hydrogenase maturation protease
MPREEHAVVVIGVGNSYRNDDAAGIVAVQRLRALAPPGIGLVEHENEGVALIDHLAGSQAGILIDATRAGSPAGTIRRFDAHDGPLPATIFRHSTHAFGVANVVELARSLNQLPARLVVYGIEGRDFGAGSQLSPEVREALPILVERVLEETLELAGEPLAFRDQLSAH